MERSPSASRPATCLILLSLAPPLLAATPPSALPPQGTPTITSIEPPVVPALQVTNEKLSTIHGSGFALVTDVLVGGISLGSKFPPAYTVEDSNTIRFAMPLLPSLGSTRVIVETFGSAAVGGAVEVVAPSDPVLRLAGGAPDTVFLTPFPFQVRAGGTPGSTHILWISQVLGPTPFPGLYDLGIGGGVAENIDFWDLIEIPPKAWNFREYDASPVAPGKTLHFQLTEFDPATGLLPMPTSNVGTAFFVL